MHIKENKANIYFIGGVNAAGKSTLLKELAIRRPDIFIVHGSKKFMDWLGLEQGDYESLRAMSVEHKDKQFGLLVEKVVSDHKNFGGGALLLDSHYLNMTMGEINDVTGTWMGFMDALLLISAPTDHLHNRIINDYKQTGRDRKLFTLGSNTSDQLTQLSSYVVKTLKTAEELSNKYSIPLHVIENADGDLDSSIQKLEELLS